MRILMAQDTFLPKLGGAEIHVWKLSKGLANRGHQITIVTATPGSAVVDGFRVHRFPYLQSQGKRAVISLPFYFPSLLRLVVSHEIVHGHYSALCSAVLGTLARSLNRPFIMTLHGYGTLDSSVQSSIWLNKWRSISFYMANKVIATSDEMAEVARRFVPEEHIVIIPNGVDTSEFTPSGRNLPHSPFRIVAIRRLVPKNGVQYLIEAMPFVLELSKKPVECWIVGDGRLRGYLEKRSKELGIEGIVRFFGSVPNKQVKEILDQVHVVVFPSSAESTSIAALEAMAMGKPIVASAVGAYPKLLGANERGLLVKLFNRSQSNYEAPLTLPEDRLRELARAIVQLIDNRELAENISMQARDYVVKTFDWKVIIDQIEKVYKEIVGKR
jgi:glycosyltransferase involved in cell wall biosynthesis